MTLTQFQAESILMFSWHIKLPKVKPATESISSSGAPTKWKTHFQKRSDSKKKMQVQIELIQQQKKKTENLKAAQATRVSLQQLVSTILQAMSCLYVGNKKATANNKETGGKKFIQTSWTPQWVPWYKSNMLVLQIYWS